MPVTVHVPSVLRAEADGATHLTLDGGGSLGMVLDGLKETMPRLERRIRDERGALRRFVNVYVDGEDCRVLGGLDAPVRPNAEIQVLPSIAGG
jgi:molybdopterin converting factor small subunit